MKKIVCIICAVMLLTLSGCLDITGSFKPGSFGKTPREEAMIKAIAGKYGDLSQKGEPRFLEARMTSNIEDYIPVDTVTKYSKDAGKLYVWFVYDNFNNDQIEVEWIYVDESYSIHTFKAKTGEDLGRGAYILERPDDGWALGNYKVIIRGRGVEKTLTFAIIEGAMVAIPLSFENGNISLEEYKNQAPGWYFTHWEYYKHPNDTADSGGKIGKFANGDTYTEYMEGKGEKNNFTNITARKLSNGEIAASGHAVTIWTDPAVYFGANDRVAITVNRVVDSSWGINGFNASFDAADINPGGGTSGIIRFATPDGQTNVQNYQGTFQMQKAAKGKVGDIKAVIVYLNGHGFKYYYEWRE